MNECTLAAATLPDATSGSDLYRVTKWAAYALKSRVALHAASVAKYWNLAPLAGEAVTQKLVGGMTSADADAFYKECIEASKSLIENSVNLFISLLRLLLRRLHQTSRPCS